jgi:hypothetical protein
MLSAAPHFITSDTGLPAFWGVDAVEPDALAMDLNLDAPNQGIG